MELGVETWDVFRETCVDTVLVPDVVFTGDPGDDVVVKLAVTLFVDFVTDCVTPEDEFDSLYTPVELDCLG